MVAEVGLMCPLVEIVASVAFAWRVSDAPFLLPCLTPFFAHRARSRSKPTPSFGGRRMAKHTVAKEKADAMHLLFLLVAEVGFEPHDLRVMSPTSYQAALLRDIKFGRISVPRFLPCSDPSYRLVPVTGVEPVRY